MMDARGWSAPRLEQAATYIENELGPKVGSMLNRTAKKVDPARPRRRGRIMALVLLAVGGVLGAVGIVAARRNTERPAEDQPADLTAVPGTEEHVSAS